jgi:predicted RNA-binding Zn ribbon-like protein
MEHLANAAKTTEQIRAALEHEVGAAREHRRLIRMMDADGLLARSQSRAEFNGRLAQLEMDLAGHLAAAGAALGLREVTLEALRERAPRDTARLSDRLAEVRALASALAELDALNKMLAERALVCVRGYVNAVVGAAPAAYDRRGATAAHPQLTTASRVV